MIPFNKPYSTDLEIHNIKKAILNGKISGNGDFTKKCQKWFKINYGFSKTLLTTSCTDALEMASILCDIKLGDEFIVPSYTFVSTVNPFLLRGGTPKFVDCLETHPCIDHKQIEKNITKKTKVIVIVHYAGISCDMEKIMNIASKYNLIVIEDAAQAIDAFYHSRKGDIKRLGSFGHFSTFSFHETKNIISGEGGMLVINDKKYYERAEIIWEKGTNRSAFFRGQVDKYGWVDIGSSFLPSEIISAYLYAQLKNLEKIQLRRKYIWNSYKDLIEIYPLIKKYFSYIQIPDYASNNAHMFYLVAYDEKNRDSLIEYLKKCGILTVFHYQSLHSSNFFKEKYKGNKLPNTDFFSNNLIRLPLFYDLKKKEIKFIIKSINDYCKNLN